MNNKGPDMAVLGECPIVFLFGSECHTPLCGTFSANERLRELMTTLHGVNVSHFRLRTSCSKKLNDYDILKCLIPLRQ